MFSNLAQAADALDARTDTMGALAAGDDAGALYPTREASQTEVVVAGRVVCDSEGEGRLNPASVLLEGSRATSGGERVRLDLIDCPVFSLFPGQVVAVKGMNGTGSKLAASSVSHGKPLPMPHTPRAALEAQAARAAAAGSGPMRVWTAAGPYCLADDLAYQPLDDLLLEATQADSPPDVMVLAGPFVDAEHPHVSAGRTRLETEDGDIFPLSARQVFMFKGTTTANVGSCSSVGASGSLILFGDVTR
jgi:DNA polymerase alpha subunit B